MADKDKDTDEVAALQDHIARHRSTSPDNIRPVWQAISGLMDLVKSQHHHRQTAPAAAPAEPATPPAP